MGHVAEDGKHEDAGDKAGESVDDASDDGISEKKEKAMLSVLVLHVYMQLQYSFQTQTLQKKFKGKHSRAAGANCLIESFSY